MRGSLRALANHGENPAAFFLGDKTAKDFPKARHRIRSGLAKGAGDPGALAVEELGVKGVTGLCEAQQALAAVTPSLLLLDEAAGGEIFQDTAEALLGDLQDFQKLADREVRLAADEMERPVMGAAEPQ